MKKGQPRTVEAVFMRSRNSGNRDSSVCVGPAGDSRIFNGARWKCDPDTSDVGRGESLV